MPWGQYDHLDHYRFLCEMEDKHHLHPDAISYIRGLVSRIEEYENQQDEFDSELMRLGSEIDQLKTDKFELEEDLIEANDLIKELKSQLEKK